MFSKVLNDNKVKPMFSLILVVLIIVLLYLVYRRTIREGFGPLSWIWKKITKKRGAALLPQHLEYPEGRIRLPRQTGRQAARRRAGAVRLHNATHPPPPNTTGFLMAGANYVGPLPNRPNNSSLHVNNNQISPNNQIPPPYSELPGDGDEQVHAPQQWAQFNPPPANVNGRLYRAIAQRQPQSGNAWGDSRPQSPTLRDQSPQLSPPEYSRHDPEQY